MKAKLTELGVAFPEDAKVKDLEALLPAEPKEEVPPEEPKKEPKDFVGKLAAHGLPDGLYHLVNDGGSFFILSPDGSLASDRSEDGEEKKKFVKLVQRFNQRGGEVHARIRARQEEAAKQGKEYNYRVEISL